MRVLDLSTGIAGPITAMLLGDFGAEVIRVDGGADVLTGDPMWQRNKRVLGRAWDSPEVAVLLATADVVITSSAAAESALGLDRADLSRLIHVSMPVLPGDLDLDPMTANAFLSAKSGVARRQSSHAGGPVESVYPHLAYVHGLWGATTAIAALIERVGSGRGQRVTVDGMHSVLVAATTTIVVDLASTAPMTAVGPGGPNPAYTSYRCADDKWLFLGGLTDKFQRAAFALLGVSDIFTDPRIADIGENLYTPDNRGWVREAVGAAFATRPRHEWLEALDEVDCPASPVEHRDAWLDHPQVVALGQRRTLHDPLVGPVVMPWNPVELHGTPVKDPMARIIADGVDWSPRATEVVVSDVCVDVSGSGPLSGYRVLDLGTVLAGPYAGMLLAELGADVVKVEPPTGDAFRVRGYPHNRGQRSLAVDLRSDDGYAAFTELARGSHIVVDNFRPGVLGRLRIDHDQLAELRPDIVTVSITGYGDVGPLAGRPGFDPVLQSVSGMMAAQGGDSAPVFFTLAVNDVTAACVSALGAVAALHHVVNGGSGQHVSTTLAAVATFMQCGEIIEYADRPAARLGHLDYAGPSELSRHYETRDGFVRLHVESAKMLVDAGLDDPDTMRQLLTHDVVDRVERVGGHAVPTRTFVDLAADPQSVESEYLEPITWPDGRTTYLPGRYAQFSRTQEKRVLIPPGLGEHSAELLREAGVPAAVIERMFAAGTLAQQGPLTSVADVGYR